MGEGGEGGVFEDQSGITLVAAQRDLGLKAVRTASKS